MKNTHTPAAAKYAEKKKVLSPARFRALQALSKCGGFLTRQHLGAHGKTLASLVESGYVRASDKGEKLVTISASGKKALAAHQEARKVIPRKVSAMKRAAGLKGAQARWGRQK